MGGREVGPAVSNTRRSNSFHGPFPDTGRTLCRWTRLRRVIRWGEVGRSEGELYRHIQLRDKTVSRAHARLAWRDSTWHLVNLSQTNPVAWNGTILDDEREQRLTDGDRIEMGEVLFTYRSR